MATQVEVFEEEAAARLPEVRLSWGAIFGGVVAALGVWILLFVFGLAIGLSTLNSENLHSIRSSGVFTGIWALVCPLVALFVGGMVAGRGAGVTTRLGGGLHGLVMWGLSILVGVYVIGATVGMVANQVASVGKSALQAGGAAVGQAKSFGVNADDALTPVNARLQQEGKPTITPDQLNAALRDALGKAAAQGSLDRNVITTSIAQNTRLSQADAEEISGRVEAQFEQWKTDLSSRAQEAGTGAVKAMENSSGVFWGLFGALALGLISSILGASLGVSKAQRRLGQHRMHWRNRTDQPTEAL